MSLLEEDSRCVAWGPLPSRVFTVPKGPSFQPGTLLWGLLPEFTPAGGPLGVFKVFPLLPHAPPAATQAWAEAAHPLSEQSRRGLLLAWSCWAGGLAFKGALVQGASSSPTCLSLRDFALGCRHLGHSFPPEGRLHAVWDVSLDT